MVKKKTRLGRGLGALLGDVKATTREEQPGTMQSAVEPGRPVPVESGAGIANAPGSGGGLREIPIEQLERGRFQPRIRMNKEALEELGASIRSQGVIQPLLVRATGPNSYEIIAGERRWRGAQLAGLTTVPAVVRDIPDQTAMAVGLIENIQRENLNAIEEARGYQRLLDEFGLTHQEVSEAVGCSRTAVTNLVRLLALNRRVQEMLETEQISMGHARALLALEDKQQLEAAVIIKNRSLSVRQAEKLVKTLKAGDNVSRKTGQRAKPSRDADITLLEEDLSARIGARVDIQHGNKKGKVVIHYHSLDELDGILEHIK